MVTAGITQGSVLGPLLWDIMYDNVLRLQLPNGSTIVGFADGIAIVSVGKTIREIQEMTNIEIRKVGAWKIVEKIEVPVGGTRIESKRAIKYLRVIIDDSLSKEHVKFIGEKDIRRHRLVIIIQFTLIHM